MDFIEACRKFISIDSTPAQGNWQLAMFCKQFAESLGLSVDVQEESYGDLGQANIIIRPVLQDQNKIISRPANEFMLQTHLDTPDPGPYGLWQGTGHNPFDAHIIEQKIYGLGAADTKLDFLCKMMALSKFATQKQWVLPPVLVGTYGGETRMIGAMKLIRKNKINPSMALVGEPTDLKIAIAGNGLAEVEFFIPFSDDEKDYRIQHNLKESTATQSRLFSGKGVHSSTPHLGDSAILKMLEYLQQLPEGIVIMEIDGGVSFNSVPSQGFLEIEPISGMSDPMSTKIISIFNVLKKIESEFSKYNDKDIIPPNPTLNIGIIRTYEDHVYMCGSCRLPPSVSNEHYESWMKIIKQECDRIGVQFRIADYKRPYRIDPETMLVRGCLAEISSVLAANNNSDNATENPMSANSNSTSFTGSEKHLTTHPSTNEASLWSRLNIPTVSFGPGVREDNIHTPNEHVKIEDLKLAIQFYENIIQRFCL